MSLGYMGLCRKAAEDDEMRCGNGDRGGVLWNRKKIEFAMRSDTD